MDNTSKIIIGIGAVAIAYVLLNKKPKATVKNFTTATNTFSNQKPNLSKSAGVAAIMAAKGGSGKKGFIDTKNVFVNSPSPLSASAARNSIMTAASKAKPKTW